MMNFSDETVEKVAKAIEDKNWGEPDAYPYMAQAALSSLTLADLMQVEEVRELVACLKAIRDSDNLPQIHACTGAILTKIRTEAK